MSTTIVALVPRVRLNSARGGGAGGATGGDGGGCDGSGTEGGGLARSSTGKERRYQYVNCDKRVGGRGGRGEEGRASHQGASGADGALRISPNRPYRSCGAARVWARGEQASRRERKHTRCTAHEGMPQPVPTLRLAISGRAG